MNDRNNMHQFISVVAAIVLAACPFSSVATGIRIS